MPTLAEAFPLLIAIARDQGVERGLGDTEAYRNTLSPPEVAHLARLAIESETKLSELMPGLQAWSTINIASETLGTRAIHTLERAGVRTWGELAAYSPQGIRNVRASGKRTTDEIVRAAIEQSFRIPEGAPAPVSASTQAAATTSALESIQMIARWARSEHGACELGIGLREVITGAPPDVTAAFNRLMGVDAEALVGTTETFDAIAGHLRAALNDSQWRVFQERLLARKPRTLEEIGGDVGVSRERIRQVQVVAEANVDEVLNSELCRPLRWRAWALAQELGAMAVADDPATERAIEHAVRGTSAEHQSLLRAAVLRLAGPYEERDGWLRRQDAPEFDVRELESLADEFGIVAEAPMRTLFANHGIRSEGLQEAVLSRSGRFRRVAGCLVTWSGSVGNKAVGLLAAHGRPSTLEALVEEIGEEYSANSVRNALAYDERTIRVNRREWGLRSWGLEEYSGLAQEIAERIEERGGVARIAEIVSDMSRLFDAKEQSVRTFCLAPMFVIEGQHVRLRRNDDEFCFDEDVSALRGVFRPATNLLTLLMSVDKDVMRGSGKGLPSAVASILGARPGQPRYFQNHHGRLGITWPTTNAFGASIGSIRALSQTTGAVEGDLVRLVFDTDEETVTVSRVDVLRLRQLDVGVALHELTAVDVQNRDPHGAIGGAIGVDAKDAYRVLSDRGDEIVAGLLPTAAVDAGVEAALADLARVLER